jgi:hypothetical protein
LDPLARAPKLADAGATPDARWQKSAHHHHPPEAFVAGEVLLVAPGVEDLGGVMSCNGFLIRTVPLGMAEPVTEALLALAETLK